MVAFAVRRPGQDVTAESVIAHCRELIASYKRPREVRFVDALPKLPNGKVEEILVASAAVELDTPDPSVLKARMTSMSYQTLLIEKSDGVGILTLNRPQKKNAMNPQLHKDMTAALEELRYDDAVRVLIITGAGDTFCAGMDLKEVFYELQDQAGVASTIALSGWQPTGAGAHCVTTPSRPSPWSTDIASAVPFPLWKAFANLRDRSAENATVGLSEINFKGFPGGSVSKTLANLFRPRDALLYGMTGRRFDGKTAADIGFVNLAFPTAQLREETLRIAREIAGKDPAALRTTKEAYRFSRWKMTWEASMNFTNAKEEELQHRQRVGWKQDGVGDFVKGKFKPGLEGSTRRSGRSEQTRELISDRAAASPLPRAQRAGRGGGGGQFLHQTKEPPTPSLPATRFARGGRERSLSWCDLWQATRLQPQLPAAQPDQRSGNQQSDHGDRSNQVGARRTIRRRSVAASCQSRGQLRGIAVMPSGATA